MSKEPIHSGHFMTSNPHSEINIEDEDEDCEVDVVDVDDSTSTQASEKRNVQDRDEKPVTFYKFGPQKTQSIAIDVSLNKLNKCIKVAYMKMTTPKWKDFKGLKLQWKHRIRLNNVIWRAYYMEFRKPDKKKKTPYCYFAVPDDDTTHTKLEGSVLEGMYWKRRMEAVCAQYKRWRTYNRHAKRKPRGCCRKRENSCGCDRTQQINMPPQSQTPQNLSTIEDFFDIDDDFDNEFTNSLFESLNAPFLFPNPKESVQCGNADIMQPGLLSLQPSIEEIMSVDGCFTDDPGHMVDSLDSYIERMPSTIQEFAHPHPMRRGPPQVSSNQQSSQQSNNLQANRVSSQSNAGGYSAKEYEAANGLNMLVDYRNQQQHLLKRTSNAPMPSLMTTNIAQPLYSQAVYEPRGLNSPGTQEHNLPTGSYDQSVRNSRRKAGIIPPTSNQSPPKPTFLNPGSLPSGMPPHTMGLNALNYMPQILAAARVTTAALGSVSSANPAFSMISTSVPLQNVPLGSRAHLIAQQTPWWLNPQHNIQQYQIDNERKTVQMLGPPQTMPNNPASTSNHPSTANFSAHSLLTNLNNSNPQLQKPTNISTAASAINYHPLTNVLSPSTLLQPNQQIVQTKSPHSISPSQSTSRSNFVSTIHDLSRYLPQQGGSSSNSNSASSTPSASLAGMMIGSQGGASPFGSGGGMQSPNPSGLSLPSSLGLYSSTTNALNTPMGYTNVRPLTQLQPLPPGKRPSVYGSQNLFITSSAGPTNPSMSGGALLQYSTADPLDVKRPDVGHQSRISTTPLPSPTMDSKGRWPGVVPSTSGARVQKVAKGVAGVSARKVTPPLQYTEMTNVVGRSSPEEDEIEEESSATLDEDVSPAGSLAPERRATIPAIKEEQDEKPIVLIPSGSKRRNASAGSSSSSRSAPADSTLHPEERKRILHLHAEKNRRSALKDGFEMLVDSIPVVDEAGVKSTNAVVLNRAAQHIRDLKTESEDRAKEVNALKDKIAQMNEKIALIQSNLPSSSRNESSTSSTNTPSMRSQVEQFFERYSKDRSKQDYRFWLMGEILNPLVQRYAENIHSDATDREQMLSSAREWLNKNWNSTVLRPIASETLVRVATKSGAFTDSTNTALPKYIMNEISKYN